MFDKVAPDRSTSPNNPFKLASLKSAPSIEPPAKLTMIVFSRLAPVKSAFDKSVSNSIDSLRLTLDMSAPERFVSDRSPAPPVVKLNSIFSQAKVTTSDLASVLFNNWSSRRFSSPPLSEPGKSSE